ncbi:MAG TPA: MFS transporter, partial [Pirellulaceae bacterium]|nr:MFS transporter [Pirellulaceae bacterium]
FGNGLVTTNLVVYLAAEYGARGLIVSLILAAPTLVGLLRQATPQLITCWGSRKEFCLAAYGGSAALLFLLPLATAPGIWPTTSVALAVLVALWCGYQTLEYFGTVALWSWLGDIAPLRIRGRVLGRRESFLSSGRLGGMLISGGVSFGWTEFFPRSTLWAAYASCGLAGALVMGSALLMLIEMPAFERIGQPINSLRSPPWWQSWLSVWRDARFRRMVGYGCWLGAVNGLLQTSQFFYGRNVLGLSLLAVLALRSETELGQTILSPTIGKWIDRWGNRPVMMIAQLLVAAATLCYLAANRQTWWPVIGAWTLFIAYAGLNIGIPNLLLKLAPPGERNAYLAGYYAWAGLAYGLGSLAGGQLFDWAAAQRWSTTLGSLRVDHYVVIFLAAWLLRSAGVLWLARISEQPAAD